MVESYDASEFMEGVKKDISLVIKSTSSHQEETLLSYRKDPTIDFAYSIHTDIGNKTTVQK